MTARGPSPAGLRAALLAAFACACLLLVPVAHSAQADTPATDETQDVFAHPVSAQELRATLLADALGEVERSRILEGRFLQRRSLRGLPRPLESSGEFLLVRDLGLQWHTLAPVEDQFVLTRSGVTRPGRSQAGRSRRVAPMGEATELMFGLFSLDLDALGRRFELFGTGTADAWRIGLRPRDRSTARAVRSAMLRGGRHVESIALVNGAGDELHIELHDVSVRSGDLTPEQRALFQ